MKKKYVMPKRSVKFIEERLIPFILREQGNGFIMEDWLINLKETYGPGETTFYFDGVEHRTPVCNHVACIGGSVDFLQRKPAGNRNNDLRVSEVLGLTLNQGKGLFYHWDGANRTYGWGWPKKYADRFAVASTPYKKAQAVVALLKEVIKTNGECLGPRD